LRSVYSWRLFEIARSWLNHCETKKEPVRLTLEQLRDVLETPESYRWDHMKKRAIEPAIKEIAEKDSLRLTYKTYKKGRAVAGIYLYVEEDTQCKLF
jgi:plasmid replication initiation protein